MIRVRDEQFLQSVADEVLQFPIYGFDAKALVSDAIVLSENYDIAVFEPRGVDIYSGHYLFKNSRGKAAITLSRRFLDEMFHKYEAKLIYGFTPVGHKAAKWMNRQLGFTSNGVIVHSEAGELELFVLHRKDFK